MKGKTSRSWSRSWSSFGGWCAPDGLARPELGQHILGGLYVTDAGLRFLSSAGDHPLQPWFVDRLRKLRISAHRERADRNIVNSQIGGT